MNEVLDEIDVSIRGPLSPKKHYQYDLDSLQERDDRLGRDDIHFRNCLRGLKHICDGSHSHIYKGIFRSEGFPNKKEDDDI